jgi:hypothetical protein
VPLERQRWTRRGFLEKGTAPLRAWEARPLHCDYDLWLGPAPRVPYHKDRCFHRFRFNPDYSGGQVTNFIDVSYSGRQQYWGGNGQ